MGFVRCLFLLFLIAVQLPCALVESASAAARWNGPAKLPSDGDASIEQIRPGTWADGTGQVPRSSLKPRFADRHAKRGRGAEKISGTISVDALIAMPGRANREIFAEFGIPIVEGVPPIVILFPQQRTVDRATGF